MEKTYREQQIILLRWLERWQKKCLIGMPISFIPSPVKRVGISMRLCKGSVISLCGQVKRVRENLEIGFEHSKLGSFSRIASEYTCLVPEVAEKLKIRQQHFSERHQDPEHSVPSHLLLPWMIKQPSLF